MEEEKFPGEFPLEGERLLHIEDEVDNKEGKSIHMYDEFEVQDGFITLFAIQVG